VPQCDTLELYSQSLFPVPTTLLIANSFSGSGSDSLAEPLKQLQGEIQQIDLDQSDDLTARIRKAGSSVDRIVLCGGDGTINRALDALVDCGLPVGIIPTGTANDLARSLGIPADPSRAIEIINSGHQRPIDIARVNGISFINALGMGLGPLTTREMDSDEKATFGVGAYLLGLLRAMRKIPRFSARIESDEGVREGHFIQITIANGIHYGGGMTVSDQARLDDARLDVLLVRARSRWRLLANALKFKTGFVENSEVLDHWQCRRLRVETQPELEVTADGEFLTHTPLKCEVIPGALKLLAPRTTG